MPIALAHRAVIAVPRENTLSYPLWTGQPHAPGSGWMTDLAGIRPGTQSQLSNELSDVNKGGSLGNSPLGLATDVFYNWGWLGVMIVPALYALGFLWLDIALDREQVGADIRGQDIHVFLDTADVFALHVRSVWRLCRGRNSVLRVAAAKGCILVPGDAPANPAIASLSGTPASRKAASSCQSGDVRCGCD